MLEEKIAAAAHSGWSEIPFCLTQDGSYSEISEDQYRIKMEKQEGRRESRVDSFRGFFVVVALFSMMCFKGFLPFTDMVLFIGNIFIVV